MPVWYLRWHTLTAEMVLLSIWPKLRVRTANCWSASGSGVSEAAFTEARILSWMEKFCSAWVLLVSRSFSSGSGHFCP